MSIENCALCSSSIALRSWAPAAAYTFLLLEGVEVLVASYLTQASIDEKIVAGCVGEVCA